jgi:predicted nuclease with RNAse H fold
MITLGIDLSSMPEGTAACRIRWMKNRAVAEPAILRCDDDELDRLIDRSDIVGIDAPFGWPEAFVEAVAGWKRTEWSKEERQQLQFRATDLYVQQETKLWPLSVSTDRIALPAMRAMALLQRHEVRDKSGGPKFLEVYPAASLKNWGLDCRGYKLLDPNCDRVRRKILRGLRKKLPWLQVEDEYSANSDALDALIASLTARAAAQCLTEKPPQGKIAAARREGWIHLPREWPRLD